ncbi:hypothetical protein V7O66_10215 [Methanolobus sp. ZRKC3]|uniref:hypothetical protein n=1 Tax=Methanolobus sp. ZRKC3 TaxID=3125786 RepID=UPI00324F26C4
MAARILLFFTALLLLLTPVANAYDFHDENIWIFQGAYQLKIGDRAELEGFTVKLHTINEDDASATILIYRNGVFKEAYFIDSGANSEQVYENELKISVGDISTDSVSLEMHKQKNERIWITSNPKTSLKTGNSMEDDDYVVKLNGLDEEGATISIEKQGNIIEGIYKTGEYEKIPDEFMMHLVYINKNTEEVFIETLRPGKPEIGISVQTDKEDYYPSEKIEYQFSLSNDGSIPLHGMLLNTGSSEGTVKDMTLQHASLDPTKVKKFVTSISPPISPVAKNITINSEIKGYDYKGNEYLKTSILEVPIKPYIAIEKDIQLLEKSAFDKEFGTDEYFLISLTIKNMANFQTALTVVDELPESFIPDNMEKAEWVILMEPSSEKTIKYYVKPTKPGNFTFVNAIAQWQHEGETYSVETDAIDESFQIHGLKVTAEKNIVSNYLYPGDETEVIISIRNTGDRQVDVSMSDVIPNDLELVSGQTRWKGELKAGDSKEITYTIMAVKVGESYLPAASVEFTDDNERRGTTSSGTPILYVDDAPLVIDYEQYVEEEEEEYYQKSEEIISTPEPVNSEITRFGAAVFMVYSFVVLFCVIAIVPATAYLYISRKYNSTRR